MFDKFNQEYSDYISTYDKIYSMENLNEEQITELYNEIKIILIEKYHVYPLFLRNEINEYSIYRYKYIKSYVTLINKFEVNSKPRESSHETFLKVLHRSPVIAIIMNDDIENFISYVNTSNFNKDEKLDLLNQYYGAFTLLESCCFFGAIQCFRYLISEFNSEITNNCAIYSFLSGNLELIHECIQGRTPDVSWIETAIISHNFDLVVYLIDTYNMEINPELCAKYHNLKTFLYFVDKSDDIERILVSAARFNLQKLFDLLLSHAKKITIQQCNINNILQSAALNYNLRIAKIAISLGADINSDALDCAAARNAVKICELFIEHGAEVNGNENFPPLFKCAEFDSAQVCSILCNSGAKINARCCYEEYTPLHYAAIYDSPKVCKILIDRGADVNECNYEHETPLHLASRYNSINVTKI